MKEIKVKINIRADSREALQLALVEITDELDNNSQNDFKFSGVGKDFSFSVEPDFSADFKQKDK